MRAKSLGSEADVLFWPGYVDAISCLVLNLLFLTMVLTIAVFILGQGQALNRSELPDPQVIAAALPSTEVPLKAQEKLPTREPRSIAPLPAPVSAKPPEVVRPLMSFKSDAEPVVNGAVRVGAEGISDALLVITLRGDTLIVPREQRDALVEKLREIDALQPEQGYEVRIATDTTLSDARRRSYVRAMSVRDVMLAAGIRPISITLRMESNGPSGGDGVVRVHRRQE